jgi:hypothetical protein
MDSELEYLKRISKELELKNLIKLYDRVDDVFEYPEQREDVKRALRGIFTEYTSDKVNNYLENHKQ